MLRLPGGRGQTARYWAASVEKPPPVDRARDDQGQDTGANHGCGDRARKIQQGGLVEESSKGRGGQKADDQENYHDGSSYYSFGAESSLVIDRTVGRKFLPASHNCSWG